MAFDLLKPANGQPKKPSEIRDNLQHLLGEALPDCILPEGEGAFGGKMSPGDGLAVDYSGFRGIIGGKYHDAAAGSLTGLAPRRAQLVYARRNPDSDSLTPSVGAVAAEFPAADAGTVCRWLIDGSDTVASTVGSNDLTKNGTVTAVDGWIGYGGKGDGSTGYYVSANSTGFPTGTNVRSLSALVTIAESSNIEILAAYGGNSAGHAGFGISKYSDNSLNLYSWQYLQNTGFFFENGKTYYIEAQYDGTNFLAYVNGVLVYSWAVALNTVAGSLKVFADADTSRKTISAIHYVEVRNTLRTPTQIAAISNALLLPCRYEVYGNQNIASPANAISGGDYSGTSKIYAFDGSTVSNQRWGSAQLGTAVNGVAYIGQSNIPLPIKKVRLYTYSVMSNNISSVKLQYTLNGSVWNDLQTVALNTSASVWNEITVDNPAYYQWFTWISPDCQCVYAGGYNVDSGRT